MQIVELDLVPISSNYSSIFLLEHRHIILYTSGPVFLQYCCGSPSFAVYINERWIELLLSSNHCLFMSSDGILVVSMDCESLHFGHVSRISNPILQM